MQDSSVTILTINGTVYKTRLPANSEYTCAEQCAELVSTMSQKRVERLSSVCRDTHNRALSRQFFQIVREVNQPRYQSATVRARCSREKRR